ncbi:hypothetical protein K466DRAFT_505362 [Polyporus arcularius HHB13444]|uniref:Velvet domain-containing protein n=1 Tax=Polyporus arcularius HHB13444 TaxID=1314778 RepID=A0A5C3NS46_9APHY|nr:hypothetical protein K466DRAFT_505362 [Polyporus arcularius HHB13444]
MQVPLSVCPSAAVGAISFTHGPFAGKTVRTSATEIQKADAGRKFARKDKRPLDPPPVVQVRFFEVHGVGTSRQYEEEILSYDDTLMLGLVCQVDLFPVVVEAGTTFTSVNRNGAPRFPPPLQAPCVSNPGSSTQTSNDADIVAYYGKHPIREPSNSPGLLAGTLVVTPITVAYNNRAVLVYTFAASAFDLAVRQEGTFSLRYRVFDIFSKTTDDGGLSHRIPVLASCFGGVFKVWSTRAFPGLSGSTQLTKTLSMYGVPVMIRSPEHRHGRKKQKTVHSDSLSDGTGSPQTRPGSSQSAS